MRHYEIVLLIHPDQGEHITSTIDNYKKIISDNKGQTHRAEEWGRRLLAFPIQKFHKAYYILFNVECSKECILELQNSFKFNDGIIRYLICNMNEKVTEPSVMMKAIEAEKNSEGYDKNLQV